MYTNTVILLEPYCGPAAALRRIDFRPFWIISFEFVKICWCRLSSWESSLVSITDAMFYGGNVVCVTVHFFHCRLFSPWWPLVFLIFSLPL